MPQVSNTGLVTLKISQVDYDVRETKLDGALSSLKFN